MGTVYLADTIYEVVLPLNYCSIIKSKYYDEVIVRLSDKSFKDYWELYELFKQYDDEKYYKSGIPIRKDILFFSVKDAKRFLIMFRKNHIIKDILY
jgi:hypothetical protein